MLDLKERIIAEFKKKTAKECYEIKIEEGTPEILDDKIGGKPYLPVGEEYPKDSNGNELALLLQINLKNIDLQGYPKQGILEIFTDNEVDYPCQYAVKYFNEGLEYQTDLPDVDISSYIVEKGYKITASKTIAHMVPTDHRFNDMLSLIGGEFDASDDELDEAEEEIWDAINIPKISLGGYPDFTQSDPRGYGEVKGKSECLFKLDSCADSDKFFIGDAGILFALIAPDDIKNCNFENAFVDWDCC